MGKKLDRMIDDINEQISILNYRLNKLEEKKEMYDGWKECFVTFYGRFKYKNGYYLIHPETYNLFSHVVSDILTISNEHVGFFDELMSTGSIHGLEIKGGNC